MRSGVDRRFVAVVDEVAVAGRFEQVGGEVRAAGRRYEASDSACLIRSRGWQPRSAILRGR